MTKETISNTKKNELLKKAAFVSIFGKYSYILINLLYTAILSRLLTPEEFGVIAIITVFTTFFTIVSQIGIAPAVVQNKELTTAEHQHIFSYTLVIASLVSILFAAFSWPISLIFETPSYIGIGILLSFSLFFGTLNIVPLALLQKKHEFFKINYRTVVVALVSSVPSIYTAFIGFSYYSIILYSILAQFLIFLWNFVKSDLKIKIIFNRHSFEKIKDFSKYQFWFNFINYFSRNLDNLLIGYYLGETNLGYYDKSYKLMTYPTNYLSHAITPVLHPIYSQYREDTKYIITSYLKIIKILSLLGVFATLSIFFNSEEIIFIIYGEQWINSALSLRYLSLSIWSQILISTTGSLYQSFNRTKLLMISGLFSMIIIVSAIAFGLTYRSINEVSFFVSLAYIVIFIKDFYILFKFVIKIRLLLLLNTVKQEFFIMILIFIFMIIMEKYIIYDNLYRSFIVKFTMITLLYMLGLLITKQLYFIIKLIPKLSIKKDK